MKKIIKETISILSNNDYILFLGLIDIIYRIMYYLILMWNFLNGNILEPPKFPSVEVWGEWIIRIILIFIVYLVLQRMKNFNTEIVEKERIIIDNFNTEISEKEKDIICLLNEEINEHYVEIAKAINTNAETLQKIKEHYVLKIEMPKNFQDKEYMQQFSANVISAIQDADQSEYKQQLPDMPILYIQITPEKSTNDNTRNI